MNKRKFDKIAEGIRTIKIQGARNIAKAALRAYFLVPLKSSIKKLKSLRPTEPMLEKVLNLVGKKSYKEILSHFDEAQERINQFVLKLIKTDDVIFTHCHSTNVVGALIYSKKKGKRFEVYNTETRPLFQGRKTARELKLARIKVTMFVDSALGIALSRKQGTRKVNKVFLGADALLKDGIINKIGSEVICQIAKNQNIPVYIIADSWKFTKQRPPIEQRKLNEVWDNAPEHIKIKNPAFEFAHKKYLAGIVTELGIMKYGDFVRRMS